METAPQVRDAVVRIQIEYVEMPQLKLTARQVQRLWSLPPEVCEAALATLIRKGFLAQSSEGAYIRRGAPRVSRDRIESLVRAS